ncbi:MAG: S-adenosylmethionine:tRNA ribosyltransferase-isomerase, partial [Clostridia bacterium]|nr:S-adenosylmethionine:tRNA ribosyltransferase-isomerase [Clostridia bacterium]
MLKTSDFDYYLPPELIAQEPAQPRDSSRLAVMHIKSGEIEHKVFRDIIDYFNAGDVLVINNTKVIPARIYGVRITSSCTIEQAAGRESNCEVLLLRRLSADMWECI